MENNNEIITKKEAKKIKAMKAIKNIITFLWVPVMLLIYMKVFYNWSINTWETTSKKAVYVVILMLGATHLLFTSITGSMKKSTILQTIILWVLLFINAVKIEYTMEPIRISDIVHLQNMGEVVGIVEGDIFNFILSIIPKFILLAFLNILLIFIVGKSDTKVKKKTRISMGIISIVIFGMLFIPLKTIENYMQNEVFKTKVFHTRNSENYSEFTFIGGLYDSLLKNRIIEPDGYNKEEIEDILKKEEKKEAKNVWEKANIIVTFSESFFDIDLISDDITFDVKPTENFNKLKEKGIFVNMISPTYGGISANIEFEFLTGHSMNFFDSGYIPFMQYYGSANAGKKLSIVKDLKENGYYTKVVFGKDYYKSESTYKKVGINEYEEKDVKEQYKGCYTSDEYLISEAIKALENKEDDKKLFYMNCTIESHMPFNESKYEKYDINVKESSYSEEMTEILHSYAQSCYDADKELRKTL